MELSPPPDNVAVGRKARRALLTNWALKVVKSQSLRGKPVTPPVSASYASTKAFKASQIKLVASQPADWDRIKALDVALTNVLQHNRILKQSIARMTRWQWVLLRQSKRRKNGKVLVVGTDGIPEARKIVETGKMTATVAQTRRISAQRVEADRLTLRNPGVIPLDKARNLNWSIQSWSLIKLNDAG